SKEDGTKQDTNKQVQDPVAKPVTDNPEQDPTTKTVTGKPEHKLASSPVENTNSGPKQITTNILTGVKLTDKDGKP
ncbi:hypothetical protein, partial [Bacillus cereus group sp. BfR-BA-01355]|uniref:hypothetical protein n=1 Tax=Bacillus cereus group sp. BfR-BA-01355 TaxID=2920318 RepID=UPI001F56FF6D